MTGRVRQSKVTFRVTDDEWLRLKEGAKRAALSSEEYIRRTCLSGKNIIVQDGEAIRNLIGEIHRIGNNVNQVARMANSTGAVSKDVISEVLAWQAEIYRLLHEMKKFNGKQ